MSKTNRFRLLTSQSFIIGVFFSFVLINSIFIYQAKVANGATQIGVAYLAKCGLASDGRSMPIYDIPQPGWPDQRIVLGNCAGRSISKYPYIQLTANKTVQLTCWDQYLINYQVLATHTGVGTYYDSANSFCNTNNGDLASNIRLIANPSPTLISLSTTTVTQGGSMVIFNGTSFLGTNNTIQISSNNSTFTNLTTQNSTNGTSIGPVNIVVNTAGNYFLRVNNTNGSTNSIPFKVVTPSTPSASGSVLTTILTPEKFTANPATIFPISFRGSNIPFSGNTVQISKDNVSFSNLAVTGISVTGSGSNEFLDFKAGMTGFGIFYIRISNSKGLSNSLQYKITPYNVPVPAPVGATPTGLSANFSLSARNVSLSWSIPSGATISSIEVERADTLSDDVSIGAYNKVATLGADATSYIDDIKNLTSSFPLHYRIRAKLSDGSYSSFSNVAVVASCVNIEGSGQKKILFMRGASTYLSTAEYLDFIRILVDGGFKTINPFKKYINNFSFYADFAVTADEIGSAGDIGKMDASVKNYNTCKGVSSNFDVYITLSSKPLLDLLGGALASNIDRGFVYMNPHSNIFAGNVFAGKEPLVLMHEVGHAFAGLKDEYIKHVTGDFETYVTKSWSGNGENCSSQPAWDYKNAADNRLYGSVVTRGCLMFSSGGIPRDSELYFRPSENSIMKTSAEMVNGQLVLTMGDNFNVVSCGYIMAAINSQALTQAVASKYFPECKAMSPAPMVSGVTPDTSSGTANTFKVSGSEFNTSENLIKLIPVSSGAMISSDDRVANIFSAFDVIWEQLKNLVPFVHGQTTVSTGYYLINNIPANGTSLSFTVPSNVPDGKYKVSVSGFDSPWNDTSYTIVVSGNGAGDPSTAIVDDDIIIGASVPGTPTPVVPAGSGVISCEYRNTAEFDRYGRMQTILSVKSGLPSDSKKYLYMMHATTIDPALKLVNLGYHYLSESWNWTIPGAAINLKTLKNVYIDVSLNNNGTLFKRVSCQQK